MANDPPPPPTRVVRGRRQEDPRGPRDVQRSVANLKQAKELLAFAKGGGRMAGWSLLGGAAAMVIALAFHLPDVATFGTIGSMAGVGVYAIRWFKKFKTPKYEEMNDELRDLNALKISGTLTDEEYVAARAKVLKRYGIT